MYKTLPITVRSVLVLLVSSLVSFSQEKQSFSLQEAVGYALDNNSNIKKAELDIKIAEGKVGEYLSIGLPQVSAKADFTYNYKIQQVILPPEFGASVSGEPVTDDTPPFVTPFGVALQSNAVASLRQLIFDGTFFLGLKATKIYKQLSIRTLTQTKVSVIENVTKAYYAVLVNQKRLEQLEKNVARLDTLLRHTKAMYANGFVEKTDADRIEVSFNNITTEKKNALRFLDLSKQLLKFQMGMDVNSPIQLSDPLSKTNFIIEENEETNYTLRPEFNILQTAFELNEINVKRYRAGYYPTLYFNINYGLNAGGNDLENLRDWYGFGALGFSLNIPIFDGFLKKNLISQAELELKKTVVDQNQLKKSIDFERNQSVIQLNSSIETLKSQERNMELANEIYEKAKIKYDEGVGSTLELTDAETSYKDAEANYFNALYEAIVAKIEYKKALGVLIKDFEN